VNALVGREVQEVQTLREHDETGVHTTTSRRVFLVPGRGCLVDTPGMRELGLCDSDSGVGAAFSEIGDLAPSCRYRDCEHRGEPGCAVTAAVEAGTLPRERLEGFRHLRRELAFVASKERKRLRHLGRRARGRPEPRRGRPYEDDA
jgi:ribosome biogenesis GTPase